MIRRYLFWFIIVILTMLPLVVEMILHHFSPIHRPFIWSLYIIPSVLLMVKYPKWDVIIGSGIFYTSLKFLIEGVMGESLHDKITLISLILGSIINWCIHLTLGYYRIKYEKMFQKVEELTIVDSLTGIYNRRYFHLYMERAIPFSQMTGNSLVLILLDIDHFKKVNDKYGHQCGDEALKHISKVINNTIRNSDTYVRFGGEEFAIILPMVNLMNSLLLAERIRDAIEHTEFTYQNNSINLTISVGIAMYSGETEAEFIEHADKALYQAKENGRNQVVIFN